jgi:hypothetical protein
MIISHCCLLLLLPQDFYGGWKLKTEKIIKRIKANRSREKVLLILPKGDSFICQKPFNDIKKGMLK